MPFRVHVSWSLAWFAVLATTGCAVTPMQPVADFGGAATRLSTVYKPFTSGMASSCEQRLRYMAVGNPGAFDVAAAQRAASHECGPLKTAGDTAALFGQALSDYASALATLSRAKPTAFDADIRGVSSAAGQLENREGTAIFDSHKLGAATKLARAAALLLLQGKLEKLSRATLVDNQEALTVVVQAMKTYAGVIYAHQLQDTHDVMAGEMGRLVLASNARTQADVQARLPWRLAQTTAQGELAANELESRRVRAFAVSADALLAAHSALILDYDSLVGDRRIGAVADFVARVQALNDDAATL